MAGAQIHHDVSYEHSAQRAQRKAAGDRPEQVGNTARSSSRRPRLMTVVVLTCNRRNEVLHTLEALRRLAGPPAIMVVDNGSTDKTAEATSLRFPEARLVSLSRNVGAASRNIGASHVRTYYVAFSDGFAVAGSGYARMAHGVLSAS